MLRPVALSSAAVRGAEREATGADVVRAGGQEAVAGEAGQGTVLGGRQSHGLVVQHHLVREDVPGGQTHPPVPRPVLHPPGPAIVTRLVRPNIKLIYSKSIKISRIL